MGCHGSVSRANKCRQSPEAKKPGGGVNEKRVDDGRGRANQARLTEPWHTIGGASELVRPVVAG